MKHKFKFWVTIEDEEQKEFWETKGETGVEAWVKLINHFGREFNCGAVLLVECEVDGKDGP